MNSFLVAHTWETGGLGASSTKQVPGPPGLTILKVKDAHAKCRISETGIV